MDVTVEQQDDIARKLTISVKADLFSQAIKSKLGQYAKNAKIPGFRPGKIPSKMIEQQYGGAAVNAAADELINQHYPKALKQEKIIPATLLAIKPTQVEQGKDFIFEAQIEIYPEIDAPNLDKKEITSYTVSVTKADIDRTLETIQKRQTEYTETDKKAKKGDQLVVDFTGTIAGEPFAGGEAKDAQIILGDGQFMTEFEDNLKSAKKGDEVIFTVGFPKDYHGVEVAGKTAEFKVSVKLVNVGKLPKLDGEFAKSMGVEGGIDVMREDIKSGLERELKQKQRTNTRDQIMAALSQKYEISIPKGPVEEEIDRAVKEIKQQMTQQGMPDQKVDRSHYEAPSKERVKLGLLVRAVIEAEKLEASKETIKKRVEEMAGGYAEPEQYVEYVMNDEQQRNQVAGVVLEDLVIDHLLKSSTVKKVKKSYEDFMSSE